MSSLIRVGVLDEQEVVRYGLLACFSELPDIAVVGGYCQVDSALRAVEQGNIDLLLMDHALKRSNGLDFIQNLSIKHPELRVLVFLADPCPATVTLLLAAGVRGIVCKRQPLEVCVQAIRALALGQSYFCSGILSTELSGSPFVQIGTKDAEEAFISHAALSPREREVLRLCIGGLTVTRIAELFDRSLKTVSAQKQAAYRKLGLKSDMDLFRRLARYGV